jgi:hypothetical protein
MRRSLCALLPPTLTLTMALAAPVQADTVADALASASSAYAAGDLNTAAAQIATAASEISARQSDLLRAHFPPAPEGWTREDTPDMAQGMAMMGGGAGAEATYADAEGMTVTLSAYADNMMVESFAPILSDPQMVAMMGKTIEINGVAFLEQDGLTTMALLDNRVLLQAVGEAAKAQALLAQIDLAAMVAFDEQ